MICKAAEPIVAVGAIIAGIPMVDKINLTDFKDGQRVTVDGYKGLVIVEE
jgi:predicted aconitase with swiveling domain